MANRDLPDPKQLGVYLTLAQVGMEMVAPLVLGVVLDVKLEWAPWGTIVGALFGLVGGVMHLVVLQNRKKSGPSQSSRNEP